MLATAGIKHGSAIRDCPYYYYYYLARRQPQKTANSHPKRNAARPEDLGWSPVVEALSRPVVQLPYVALQLPVCQL